MYNNRGFGARGFRDDDRFDDVGSGRTPKIMTIDQASRMLQISKSTLYHWICSGKIKRSVKRGKPTRFDRDLLIDEFFGR